MEKLDEKIIIDNGFWKVKQSFYRMGEGKEGNVITMEKSKNVDAIFVLPITKNKEIIYINEFKFGPQKYQFGLPAGGVDNIEDSLEETAKRELEEETGYTSDNFINLGFYNHNPYINGKIYLFLALNVEYKGNTNLQDIEDIETKKCSILEFENMIKNNTIECSFTALAFLRAKEYTNNFNLNIGD